MPILTNNIFSWLNIFSNQFIILFIIIFVIIVIVWNFHLGNFNKWFDTTVKNSSALPNMDQSANFHLIYFKLYRKFFIYYPIKKYFKPYLFVSIADATVSMILCSNSTSNNFDSFSFWCILHKASIIYMPGSLSSGCSSAR